MRLVSGEAGVTRVWRDGHSISTWFLPCDDRQNHRVFGRSQFERVPVYIVMKSRTAQRPGNAPVTCRLWQSIGRCRPLQETARALALHQTSRLTTRLSGAHPCRIGKPAAKMMTPVRYILLALFLVVRITL